MKTVRISVIGQVQGVNLRWWCKETASEFHLSGYVENQYDGSVTVVCQGSEDNIREFMKRLTSQSTPGDIKEITSQEVPAAPIRSTFSIRGV